VSLLPSCLLVATTKFLFSISFFSRGLEELHQKSRYNESSAAAEETTVEAIAASSTEILEAIEASSKKTDCGKRQFIGAFQRVVF
jgi:hypothetical protein